jgi:hypothetical protein
MRIIRTHCTLLPQRVIRMTNYCPCRTLCRRRAAQAEKSSDVRKDSSSSVSKHPVRVGKLEKVVACMSNMSGAMYNVWISVCKCPVALPIQRKLPERVLLLTYMLIACTRNNRNMSDLLRPINSYPRKFARQWQHVNSGVTLCASFLRLYTRM